jgi:hypothetical protein
VEIRRECLLPGQTNHPQTWVKNILKGRTSSLRCEGGMNAAGIFWLPALCPRLG